MNAQFDLQSMDAVEYFFKSRGRVETPPQYQGEAWGMCAGGSLHACQEDRLEKLGGCARVSFVFDPISIDLG